MRFLDYDSWKKRHILVIKMMSSSGLEENLRMLEIPVISVDYEEDFPRAWENLKDKICGIIISGSKLHTRGELLEPTLPDFIIESDVKKLGICFGNEILGNYLGSDVIFCPEEENDSVIVDLEDDEIFEGIDTGLDWTVTMHHRMMLDKVPPGAKLIASTSITPVAGFHHVEKGIWGLQFHPEKNWMGDVIFKNFYKLCSTHP